MDTTHLQDLLKDADNQIDSLLKLLGIWQERRGAVLELLGPPAAPAAEEVRSPEVAPATRVKAAPRKRSSRTASLAAPPSQAPAHELPSS